MDKEAQIEKLKLDKSKLINVLQTIINSCVHPDIAVRCVMVDLKPIRKVLKEVEE